VLSVLQVSLVGIVDVYLVEQVPIVVHQELLHALLVQMVNRVVIVQPHVFLVGLVALWMIMTRVVRVVVLVVLIHMPE
jgi:hypothetical protein